MGEKENRNSFRRQRTGCTIRRILTVLFVCVFLGSFLTACGGKRQEEFALKAQGDEWAESVLVKENGQEPGTVLTGGSASGTSLADESAPGAAREPGEKVLCVHVCGAVVSPGLVEVPEGSRIYDALELAGGFAQDADRNALNLAARVEDGQQIYVPVQGEERAPEQTASKKINLNTADEKELCSLSGIGATRAKAILQYRREQGGFTSIEELMRVPGIKEAVFQKICDQVTVK